jgi:hypothetical protein
MTLMPILPCVGDDDMHLEAAVAAAKDHGGSFVLAAGLSMMGAQAERTLAAAVRLDPSLEARWRKMYRWAEGGRPNYGPPPEYSARLGLKIRELCARHGLRDRMPRYTGSGPLAVNKRIAERLFLKMYGLELEQAAQPRIWAYRKAAWTADEWSENIAELFSVQGEAGLRALPGIGSGIAAEIGKILQEETQVNSASTKV